MRRLAVIFLPLLVTVSCLGRRPEIEHPEAPADVAALALAGQFSIPSLGRFPPVMGLPFGGISGLTAHEGGRELVGISDARFGGRLYTFAVEDQGGSLRVTTLRGVSLGLAPEVSRPDHEGIALLPDGTLAVAAEGTGGEPRLPPSISVYGRHGDFVRHIQIPDKFIPEKTGPATRGARDNFGFESLTLSPDAGRLFTAAETALIQDGDPASFESGARTRILELVPRRDTFEPAREFAYDLEPVQKPPYATRAAINGLVELLAVNRTTLLALERGYVEDAKDPARHHSIIRLFRISLAGATDVSAMESLRDRTDVVPVTKTPLLDLSKVQGLSRELAPGLDNFEGMTFGPRLPDGRASLLLVSDDNFNGDQRTWFLLFAIQ
jgi:hypothetical protein